MHKRTAGFHASALENIAHAPDLGTARSVGRSKVVRSKIEGKSLLKQNRSHDIPFVKRAHLGLASILMGAGHVLPETGPTSEANRLSIHPILKVRGFASVMTALNRKYYQIKV